MPSSSTSKVSETEEDDPREKEESRQQASKHHKFICTQEYKEADDLVFLTLGEAESRDDNTDVLTWIDLLILIGLL
jgi:hypothetical protein